MNRWQESLAAVGAPAALVSWAQSLESRDAALRSCPRPDWLVWIARAGATSVEQQRAVLRAASAVMTLARPMTSWRRHVFRLRPDAIDDVALFCGDSDTLNDSDHGLADWISGSVVALVLWAPFDVYLFVRPLSGLAGVRREIVTLPALALLAYAARRIWTRLRLAAARRLANQGFASIWERLAPHLDAAMESSARRAAQSLAARRALGLPDTPSSL
jgi:hypothetical protein